MFKDFKLAIQRQFKLMSKGPLYEVEVDKDLLWDTYLNSFPVGTNPIYKERAEHDCQCCKHFIRTIGNVVSIENGKLVSIWDVNISGHYQVVADILSNLIKSSSIDNIYLHTERHVGTTVSCKQTENGVKTWEHFYVQLPGHIVTPEIGIGLTKAEAGTTKEVMLRSLEEISVEALETVVDLIGQNSLYRGEENRFAVETFLQLKKEFNEAHDKDIFCWHKSRYNTPAISRIRNTVIGTLLVDLSIGVDLEGAIRSFESKVAPANYKRPTAPITKVMIEKAKIKLDELGLTSALDRRFAVLEDISINNVLFADREARKQMNDIFDELTNQTSSNIHNLDKVEEVGIEDFIANILPKATSLELMFENRHSSNLVSLIAPSDFTAKGMFKWPNNFSWSYAGEMADSIKERVKNAGGNVEGDLRCSLSWFNYDDLDLHMIEPDKTEIFFGRKISIHTGGNLDVDMNAGSGKTRNAVENICYPNRRKMEEGTYTLYVNNYCKRESSDVGFEAEIEFDGTIHHFSYASAVVKNVVVAEIEYSHKDGFKIVKHLPSTQTVKNIWNIPTQTFHKVSLMLLSPNHWDEKFVGNKHYFFILERCLNDGKARGFFNEFLSEELNTHRKVFEVIGSKMKVESAENQLSGLGFSSTQRNSVMCKVKGSFTRIIKITF